MGALEDDQRFETLVSLLQDTGLDEALSGSERMLTIFAPTNKVCTCIVLNNNDTNLL